MAVAEYRIRRSPRARRVRVTVDPDGSVTVTLPRKAPERAAAEAVKELAPWIARRRRDARPRGRGGRAAAPAPCPTSASTLTLRPSRGRERVHRRGDVAARPGRRPASRRSSASTAAPRAPRSRRGSTPRPPAPARRYTGLTIRGQRTRWASCSSEGAMSFNWRLLLAPARDPRLRRRARGLPPRGDGPLAALLGAAGVARAGLARARRLAAALRLDARRSEPTHAAQRVVRALALLLLDHLPPDPARPGLGLAVAAHVDARAHARPRQLDPARDLLLRRERRARAGRPCAAPARRRARAPRARPGRAPPPARPRAASPPSARCAPSRATRAQS